MFGLANNNNAFISDQLTITGLQLRISADNGENGFRLSEVRKQIQKFDPKDQIGLKWSLKCNPLQIMLKFFKTKQKKHPRKNCSTLSIIYSENCGHVIIKQTAFKRNTHKFLDYH